MMTKKAMLSILGSTGLLLLAAAPAEEGRRQFRASGGGKLVLDLQAGGEVQISGTGGASVNVSYGSSCTPACEIGFEESRDGVKIKSRFVEGRRSQSSDIVLRIEVPRRFDVELESMGGGLSIDGVEGSFTGKTNGGELTLHDVRGRAELKTMGGEIRLTDSELDGALETMGGEVLFQDVVGDVRGSSMGGNVRYSNVRRRDGKSGSPPHVGEDPDEISAETVQVSTMGGPIEVEEAPEGAELHTMGGDITVQDARGFVRAKTMGGDITIAAVDGWVKATTMAGDIEVRLTGGGGAVDLASMAGDVRLVVLPGIGLDLDLELAFTRNSTQEYGIETPNDLKPTTSPDWDYGKGTPRRTIKAAGPLNGGGHAVKVRTINGNIVVEEGRSLPPRGAR